MKFTGMYDDPIMPVLQHIRNICDRYNATGDLAFLDMLRGAMNMAHTFGIDSSVYQDPDTCALVIVRVYDTNTEELASSYCNAWPHTERKFPYRMPLHEECSVFYTTDRIVKKGQVKEHA